MPNQQLIDYVKQATEQGQPREQIKTALLGAGWQEGDIEMAFSPVAGIPVPQPLQVIASSFNNTQTASVTAPEVIYGGFWIRFLAFVLDNFIISLIIVFPIRVVVVGATILWGNTTVLSPGFVIFGIMAFVLQVILACVYYIVLTHKKQATFGKRLLGLRVVFGDGSRLSLGKIIQRETLGKILSILILGIGYLMVAFTSRKQGLHDKIAGSVVLSNPKERKTWAFVVSIILAVVPFILILIGLLAAVTLSSLNNARAKGSDAAVGANLSNIRASAEVVYDMNGGYGNILVDSAVANSLRAAEAAAKAKAEINVTDTAYAIYLPLKKPIPPATGWCVDSTGFSKQSVSPGITTSCSSGGQVKSSDIEEPSVLSETDNELIALAIKKYYENVKPGTIYAVSHKKVSADGTILEDFVYNLDTSTNQIIPVKTTKGVTGNGSLSMRYSDPIKTLEKVLLSGELRTSTFGVYRLIVTPFLDAQFIINKDGIVTGYELYSGTRVGVKFEFVDINRDFSRMTIRTTEYNELGIKGQVIEEVYIKK